MRRRWTIWIAVSLCALLLMGYSTGQKAQEYEVKESQYQEKETQYAENALKYQAKDAQYEEKALQYQEKAAQYEERAKQDKPDSTCFSNFHSGLSQGAVYSVSGTAYLVEDDEHAILTGMDVQENVSLSITGSITIPDGEADLYLISSDSERTCILPGEALRETPELSETLELEPGTHQIILKGSDSVVDFRLELTSEHLERISFQ